MIQFVLFVSKSHLKVTSNLLQDLLPHLAVERGIPQQLRTGVSLLKEMANSKYLSLSIHFLHEFLV